MRAVKIPRDQRILLLAGATRVTRLRFLRTQYLTRWSGQLPDEGVLTPTGLAAGCCGHYSFWRLRILLHRHPGDKPVPEDMKAALRGEAPVPEWFADARPQTRQCARCGHVLVDEDDQGWYYQTPVSMEFPPDMDFPAGTVLTFMDRVHECDGKPHEVVARAAA